jgi:hypothetical protein
MDHVVHDELPDLDNTPLAVGTTEVTISLDARGDACGASHLPREVRTCRPWLLRPHWLKGIYLVARRRTWNASSRKRN